MRRKRCSDCHKPISFISSGQCAGFFKESAPHKTARNFLGAIHLAAAVAWLN